MDMVCSSGESSKECSGLHRANTGDMPVKRMMVSCEPFAGSFKFPVVDYAFY